MFHATRLVSTETYPGGKRRIHVVRALVAHLLPGLSTRRGKIQRIAYCAISSTIDETGQLWLGETKFSGIRDRGFRLSPNAFPNERGNRILHQCRIEMLASP